MDSRTRRRQHSVTSVYGVARKKHRQGSINGSLIDDEASDPTNAVYGTSESVLPLLSLYEGEGNIHSDTNIRNTPDTDGSHNYETADEGAFIRLDNLENNTKTAETLKHNTKFRKNETDSQEYQTIGSIIEHHERRKAAANARLGTWDIPNMQLIGLAEGSRAIVKVNLISEEKSKHVGEYSENFVMSQNSPYDSNIMPTNHDLAPALDLPMNWEVPEYLTTSGSSIDCCGLKSGTINQQEKFHTEEKHVWNKSDRDCWEAMDAVIKEHKIYNIVQRPDKTSYLESKPEKPSPGSRNLCLRVLADTNTCTKRTRATNICVSENETCVSEDMFPEVDQFLGK